MMLNSAKYVIWCVLLLLIQGCAGIAGYKNYDETEFVKTSQGQAGGLVKAFRGSANYCMLELHAIDGYIAVKATYTDGSCTIEYSLQDPGQTEGVGTDEAWSQPGAGN